MSCWHAALNYFFDHYHKHLKYITVKKIAILASGSGSNAENIANYFAGSDYAEVSFIIANNPNAFVLERAACCM